MRYLFRGIGLGLVLLLPVVASCPRPTPPPPPPPPPPIENPLVPGAPPARDAKMFREQLQTYLTKGGPDASSARQTRERFIAAMGHGNGIPGVTVNTQAVTCGDQGCFTEVRYVNQVAVHRFDLRMQGGDSPFMKWGWGAGRTVPEPVEGGLVATWYFNAQTRNR